MIPALTLLLAAVPLMAQDDMSSAAADDLVSQARATATRNSAAPAAGAPAASAPASGSAADSSGFLTLECGANGELLSLTGGGAASSSSSPDPNGRMQLTDRARSLDSNRSGSYSVAELRRIVDDAVRWGADPYLAAAIDVHENSVANGNPENNDLDWMIHQPALLNAMGCNGVDAAGRPVNAAAPTFNLAPGGPSGGRATTVRACLPEVKDPWTSLVKIPGLIFDPGPAGGGVLAGCCANLEIPSALSDTANPQANAKINALFKNFVATRAVKELQAQAPERGAVFAIQSWNGHGEVRTPYASIYNHLDMGRCPVYGNAVADVMTNMLMNNPEFVDLVRQARAKNGERQPISIFCLGRREFSSTTVPLDPGQFAARERAYMADPGCRDAR